MVKEEITDRINDTNELKNIVKDIPSDYKLSMKITVGESTKTVRIEPSIPDLDMQMRTE